MLKIKRERLECKLLNTPYSIKKPDISITELRSKLKISKIKGIKFNYSLDEVT